MPVTSWLALFSQPAHRPVYSRAQPEVRGNTSAVGAVVGWMAALFGLLVSLLLGLVVHRGDFFMHSTLRLIAGNIDNG
jgi:hypothetical protein